MTPKDFKQARESLGLSLAQLAKILGVDPRTVRRWEQDGDTVLPMAANAMIWFRDCGFRPVGWPKKPAHRKSVPAEHKETDK